MKKLNIIFLFLVFTATSGFSQYLKYGVSNVKAGSPDLQQQMEGVMKSMVLESSAKADTVVSMMNTMGGMVTMKTFGNSKDKNFVMYMDMMGNKMKVIPTADELNELEKEQLAKKSEMSMEEFPNETKTILGFKCRKVKVTMPDNITAELYITNDIKMAGGTRHIRGMEGLELNGLPLEYMIDSPQGVKITFVAQKYEPVAPANSFDIPRGNFKEMNYTEFKKQVPGM